MKMESYTKSLLSKLPKEILIEIIEKQNSIDYFTSFGECDKLKELCEAKRDELYKIYKNKIYSLSPKTLIFKGKMFNLGNRYFIFEKRKLSVSYHRNIETVTLLFILKSIEIEDSVSSGQKDSKDIFDQLKIFLRYEDRWSASKTEEIDITENFRDNFSEFQNLYNYINENKDKTLL